ncbi:prepilin-type N-terminal cleavage/methylation domain-containing protein [Oscillospiraceae bacterium WX1]
MKEGKTKMMQLMQKSRNNLNKRRALGNKGFSLVELIIVIAIMAVLVAILAPQYLKYVEKSRVSADNTFADSLLSTTRVILSDDDFSATIDENFVVTWTNGSVAVTGNDNAAVAAALASALPGYATKAIQSNAHKAAASDTYTITVTFTNGVGAATSAWA